MTNKSEIAELRAELDKVKRQLSGADMPSEAEVAAYRAKVHADREARATAAATLGFSKGDLAAMRAACPDDLCRDLATDARAPLTPKGVIPESEKGNVRGRVSGGSGWAHISPLKNGIGEGR